jgi:hypothetical protein
MAFQRASPGRRGTTSGSKRGSSAVPVTSRMKSTISRTDTSRRAGTGRPSGTAADRRGGGSSCGTRSLECRIGTTATTRVMPTRRRSRCGALLGCTGVAVQGTEARVPAVADTFDRLATQGRPITLLSHLSGSSHHPPRARVTPARRRSGMSIVGNAGAPPLLMPTGRERDAGGGHEVALTVSATSSCAARGSPPWRRPRSRERARRHAPGDGLQRRWSFGHYSNPRVEVRPRPSRTARARRPCACACFARGLLWHRYAAT